MSKCRWMVVAVLVSVGLFQVWAETNMLTDAGFEAGGTGWRLKRSWTVTDGEGYKGGRALVWEGSASGGSAICGQRVTLTPGGVYRYSVLVKVDELDATKCRKPKQAISVGLEWKDRDGKWLAGSYGLREADNDVSLKDGWVRYSGRTAPMPANVGAGTIFCLVRKGATGRIRFDDVILVREALETIPYFVSSACRDEAVDGKVRFMASLHVDTVVRPFSDYAAEITYRAADGKNVVLPAAKFDPETARFELDVASLASGAQDIVFRLKVKADDSTVGTRKLRFTRLAAPVRRRVTFDRQLRTYVDGKPFFPIGLYTGNGNTREDTVRFREAGFNFTTRYGTPTLEELDWWHEAGVMVAVNVRAAIDGYPKRSDDSTIRTKTRAESRKKLRAAVEKFGRHPALFGWYLSDEPPPGVAKNIAAASDFLHEIDPEHLTFSTLNRPKSTKDFLPAFDLVATDCYPIGYHDEEPDFARVAEWSFDANRAMAGFRPFWHVPQAFNWGWYRKKSPNPWHRMPTREELGNMTWQGIAAGANGICFYAYHCVRDHLKGEAFDRAWGDIVTVGREVRRMETVLTADPLPPPNPMPKGLMVRGWRQGGRDWYLIVNRHAKPFKGVVPLNRDAAALETSVGEGVTLAGRSLACDFKPLGYVLISLKEVK